SFASRRSGLPVQSPYRHSPIRSSSLTAGACSCCPPAIAAAVWRQRSSGLLTIASSRTGPSRAASTSACARPRSSSGMPGVQPVSTVPVGAVSPCRTSRTKVTPRLYGLPAVAAGRLGRPTASAQPDAGGGDPQRDVGNVIAGHGEDRADERVGEQHVVIGIAEAVVEQQAQARVVPHCLGD